MCSGRARVLWIRHVCLPQQGCGWRGRSLGVLDATFERSSGLLKRTPKRQGYATRHGSPCNACPIRSRSPLKAASLIFQGAIAMLHDGPTSVGRWRLGVGCFDALSSTRSAAVTTRDKHRDRHPREWAPRAHEVRCAHAQKGTARRPGTNYRCGMQSRCNRTCIMHPPPACTHACSVNPCLGVDSQRTVTHKGGGLAHINCRYQTPLVCRDLCTMVLLGSNTPSVHRNLLAGTRLDTTLGNLHRHRGVHTSESVAMRLVLRGCGRQKRLHRKGR
jgi:hypothetical protein